MTDSFVPSYVLEHRSFNLLENTQWQNDLRSPRHSALVADPSISTSELISFDARNVLTPMPLEHISITNYSVVTPIRPPKINEENTMMMMGNRTDPLIQNHSWIAEHGAKLEDSDLLDNTGMHINEHSLLGNGNHPMFVGNKVKTIQTMQQQQQQIFLNNSGSNNTSFSFPKNPIIPAFPVVASRAVSERSNGRPPRLPSLASSMGNIVSGNGLQQNLSNTTTGNGNVTLAMQSNMINNNQFQSNTLHLNGNIQNNNPIFTNQILFNNTNNNNPLIHHQSFSSNNNNSAAAPHPLNNSFNGNQVGNNHLKADKNCSAGSNITPVAYPLNLSAVAANSPANESCEQATESSISNNPDTERFMREVVSRLIMDQNEAAFLLCTIATSNSDSNSSRHHSKIPDEPNKRPQILMTPPLPFSSPKKNKAKNSGCLLPLTNANKCYVVSPERVRMKAAFSSCISSPSHCLQALNDTAPLEKAMDESPGGLIDGRFNNADGDMVEGGISSVIASKYADYSPTGNTDLNPHLQSSANQYISNHNNNNNPVHTQQNLQFFNGNNLSYPQKQPIIPEHSDNPISNNKHSQQQQQQPTYVFSNHTAVLVSAQFGFPMPPPSDTPSLSSPRSKPAEFNNASAPPSPSRVLTSVPPSAIPSPMLHNRRLFDSTAHGILADTERQPNVTTSNWMSNCSSYHNYNSNNAININYPPPLLSSNHHAAPPTVTPPPHQFPSHQPSPSAVPSTFPSQPSSPANHCIQNPVTITFPTSNDCSLVYTEEEFSVKSPSAQHLNDSNLQPSKTPPFVKSENSLFEISPPSLPHDLPAVNSLTPSQSRSRPLTLFSVDHLRPFDPSASANQCASLNASLNHHSNNSAQHPILPSNAINSHGNNNHNPSFNQVANCALAQSANSRHISSNATTPLTSGPPPGRASTNAPSCKTANNTTPLRTPLPARTVSPHNRAGPPLSSICPPSSSQALGSPFALTEVFHLDHLTRTPWDSNHQLVNSSHSFAQSSGGAHHGHPNSNSHGFMSQQQQQQQQLMMLLMQQNATALPPIPIAAASHAPTSTLGSSPLVSLQNSTQQAEGGGVSSLSAGTPHNLPYLLSSSSHQNNTIHNSNTNSSNLLYFTPYNQALPRLPFNSFHNLHRTPPTFPAHTREPPTSDPSSFRHPASNPPLSSSASSQRVSVSPTEEPPKTVLTHFSPQTTTVTPPHPGANCSSTAGVPANLTPCAPSASSAPEFSPLLPPSTANPHTLSFPELPSYINISNASNCTFTFHMLPQTVGHPPTALQSSKAADAVNNEGLRRIRGSQDRSSRAHHTDNLTGISSSRRRERPGSLLSNSASSESCSSCSNEDTSDESVSSPDCRTCRSRRKRGCRSSSDHAGRRRHSTCRMAKRDHKQRRHSTAAGMYGPTQWTTFRDVAHAHPIMQQFAPSTCLPTQPSTAAIPFSHMPPRPPLNFHKFPLGSHAAANLIPSPLANFAFAGHQFPPNSSPPPANPPPPPSDSSITFPISNDSTFINTRKCASTSVSSPLNFVPGSHRVEYTPANPIGQLPPTPAAPDALANLRANVLRDSSLHWPSLPSGSPPSEPTISDSSMMRESLLPNGICSSVQVEMPIASPKVFSGNSVADSTSNCRVATGNHSAYSTREKNDTCMIAQPCEEATSLHKVRKQHTCADIPPVQLSTFVQTRKEEASSAIANCRLAMDELVSPSPIAARAEDVDRMSPSSISSKPIQLPSSVFPLMQHQDCLPHPQHLHPPPFISLPFISPKQPPFSQSAQSTCLPPTLPASVECSSTSAPFKHPPHVPSSLSSHQKISPVILHMTTPVSHSSSSSPRSFNSEDLGFGVSLPDYPPVLQSTSSFVPQVSTLVNGFQQEPAAQDRPLTVTAPSRRRKTNSTTLSFNVIDPLLLAAATANNPALQSVLSQNMDSNSQSHLSAVSSLPHHRGDSSSLHNLASLLGQDNSSISLHGSSSRNKNKWISVVSSSSHAIDHALRSKPSRLGMTENDRSLPASSIAPSLLSRLPSLATNSQMEEENVPSLLHPPLSDRSSVENVMQQNHASPTLLQGNSNPANQMQSTTLPPSSPFVNLPIQEKSPYVPSCAYYAPPLKPRHTTMLSAKPIGIVSTVSSVSSSGNAKQVATRTTSASNNYGNQRNSQQAYVHVSAACNSSSSSSVIVKGVAANDAARVQLEHAYGLHEEQRLVHRSNSGVASVVDEKKGDHYHLY